MHSDNDPSTRIHISSSIENRDTNFKEATPQVLRRSQRIAGKYMEHQVDCLNNITEKYAIENNMAK